MSDYYIGIDGGSSRSTGVLADRKLRVLHRAFAGCANYHLAGLEGTGQVLLTLVESLCAAVGLSPGEIEGFCFALSGVSRPADFRKIEGLLRQLSLHEKAKVISDVEAAFLGGTGNEAGIVVISGTGSVVFGRNEYGKAMKVGGHGHLIGDPGSGYDIGIRALRAAISAWEGRGEETELTGKVLGEASLQGVDDIVPWLHSLSTPKPTIAALAPVVIAASQDGDKVAGQILRLAAQELADLVVFAAFKLALTDAAFDVILSGGVFEHNPTYFHLMESVLSGRIPSANPRLPENEPAFGAIAALVGRPGSPSLYGLEPHSGTKDDLPSLS